MKAGGSWLLEKPQLHVLQKRDRYGSGGAECRGCPYFLAVPNHRHMLQSHIMDSMFVFGHLKLLGHSCFGLWCCQIGSVHSRLCSHDNSIIAQTRSMELQQSSVALPYMLTNVSSCSADSGLTKLLATAYASCLTHAVCSSMYTSAPALASCSSVQPLDHWDR
jgi:hypothetical protein